MNEVKSNDVKKGTVLRLTGGREAEMYDNMRGGLRMVRVLGVNGYFDEIGSVYVSEILYAKVADDWYRVVR
jgi:hypothetical protein